MYLWNMSFGDHTPNLSLLKDRSLHCSSHIIVIYFIHYKLTYPASDTTGPYLCASNFDRIFRYCLRIAGSI